MKIIGKNSLAKFVNWGIAFVFLFFLFHFILFLIGYPICWYNAHTEYKFLPNIFTTGEELYSGIKEDTFSIKYPFTSQNFFKGVFSNFIFFQGLLGFAGFSFYFYCLKRIFENFSNDIIFSHSLLKWTKIFLWFNVVFIGLYITFWYLVTKLVNPIQLVFSLIPFLLITLITVFALAFFKKGYELQSENDLTI